MHNENRVEPFRICLWFGFGFCVPVASTVVSPMFRCVFTVSILPSVFYVRFIFFQFSLTLWFCSVLHRIFFSFCFSLAFVDGFISTSYTFHNPHVWPARRFVWFLYGMVRVHRLRVCACGVMVSRRALAANNNNILVPRARKQRMREREMESICFFLFCE